MTNDLHDPENLEWYTDLQRALKQAVEYTYQGRWRYSLVDDKGLASDIVEREGEFEIVEMVYAEENHELVIYAKLGLAVKTARQAHEVIHQIMSVSDEGYFVFVPLHTPEVLQFWFLTGYKSHGHAGRIVVRREDNPHFQFETAPLDM